MTGMSIALAALCVLPAWLLLGGCYQGVRVLRARAEAAERREAKANEDRIAAEARYAILADSFAARGREAVELRTDRERHAEALAEQVEECARLEAAVAQAERDYNGLAVVLSEKTKECDRLTAALAEGDRRWIGAIRSERAKAHPSGAVVRALDGVVRAVRGDL